MSVCPSSSMFWSEIAEPVSESGGMPTGMHESTATIPLLRVVASPSVEAVPCVVPKTDEPTVVRSRPRIRPVRGRRPSVFQHGLAQGCAVVEVEGNRSEGYRTVKRAIDIAGAAALLLVFSPILLGVYLVLLITTRGKPIYRQTRLGSGGRPFTMYKFRTMRVDADRRLGEVVNEKDGPIFKNRRDPRVTRLGRLLRVTSLDETPQLVNVLLGEMSLVGPRPPISKEVARYEPWQRRRLSVTPGLTCLWQVSGRSEIGFKEWVRMDLWYVQNQSVATDLWLLLKTPWCVLTGRGAY